MFFRPTVVVLIFFISIQMYANPMTFITHNTQGKVYTDENNELRGKKHAGRRAFNVELVREMMILMNHPRVILDYPFKRGMKTVLEKPNSALFNVTRKPSREDMVKWVGPLQEDITYFFEMKNAPTSIQTLDDAKKVESVCVLNGGIYEIFLKKNNFKNLISVNSYAQCFKMLKKGRVALTSSSLLALPQRLKDANIQNDTIKRTPVFLFKTQGYLAFSKDISDEKIHQWQNALDSLKKSGVYDQLVRDYLLIH